VKIKENFSYLLDEKKPLLPQLRKVKRACFRPYCSDLQLIRYKCEECAERGDYSRCEFFESTHLFCFQEILGEIMKNDSIHKPKQFHPAAERLCFGRTTLEKILKGAWPLLQHETIEPKWLGTDEHRKWNKEKKELQQDLPCESSCKMSDWCQFYQNDFERKLCITTIDRYDNDTVYFDKKYSTKTDKGYRVDSYLYKTFVSPSKIKELPPIKTDGSWKKLDNWYYSIYEKIYKSIAYQKKHKIFMLKGILDIFINEPNEEEFFKKINEYMSFDYKKIRNLIQKNKEELSEAAEQLIEIDFTFWQEWVKQQHLNFTDVLYSYYLFQEKTPSREEIQKKFNISQPTQILIEKRLGIRKDFRNKEKIQLSNSYLTNPYTIGAIFKTVDKEKRKEFLGKIQKRNKEKLNKEKLFNNKGQIKLNNKQLNQLKQIHEEMING